MSQTLCNFFRFLKLILDPPHGGQSSRAAPAYVKKNFFVSTDKYVMFVLKLISATRQAQICKEIQSGTNIDKDMTFLDILYLRPP